MLWLGWAGLGPALGSRLSAGSRDAFGPGMGHVYNYEYAKCQATEKCGFKLHEIIASHSATNEISDTTCPPAKRGQSWGNNSVSNGTLFVFVWLISIYFIPFSFFCFLFLFVNIFQGNLKGTCRCCPQFCGRSHRICFFCQRLQNSQYDSFSYRKLGINNYLSGKLGKDRTRNPLNQ